jgi:hypothetical protein
MHEATTHVDFALRKVHFYFVCITKQTTSESHARRILKKSFKHKTNKQTNATNRLAGWLIDWLAARLAGCPTGWLTD